MSGVPPAFFKKVMKFLKKSKRMGCGREGRCGCSEEAGEDKEIGHGCCEEARETAGKAAVKKQGKTLKQRLRQKQEGSGSQG